MNATPYRTPAPTPEPLASDLVDPEPWLSADVRDHILRSEDCKAMAWDGGIWSWKHCQGLCGCFKCPRGWRHGRLCLVVRILAIVSCVLWPTIVGMRHARACRHVREPIG